MKAEWICNSPKSRILKTIILRGIPVVANGFSVPEQDTPQAHPDIRPATMSSVYFVR